MTVREIAEDVRMWAEVLQEKAKRWSGDLCGMCAIASLELAHRLSRHGYDPVLAITEWHCFVLVHDCEWVVDITATQFGDDEVVIRPWRDSNGWHWNYQKPSLVRDLSHASICRAFEKWNEGDQHPIMYREGLSCS
jgi:hypothetical protein